MHESPVRQPRFILLSNHGHALLAIAETPDVRLREIAERIGITERTTQSIVNDLVDAGYVQRTRRGRRNTYTVDPRKPFTHPALGESMVGSLLSGLVPWKQADAEGGLFAAPGAFPAEVQPEPDDLNGDEGLERLAAAAAGLVDAPICFISIICGESETIAAGIGVSADLMHRDLPLDGSICREVASAGPLVVADAAHSPLPSGNPVVAAHGLGSWAAVPLASPSGVYDGCLCVADTMPRTWTESNVRMLAGMAAAAAAEIAARVAARRQSEAAKRYRLALDSLPEPLILVFDRELRIQVASGAALARAGVTPGDLVGRSLDEVVAPDRRAVLREHYLAGLDGKRHEFPYSAADGRPLSVAVVPLFGESGAVTAVMSLAREQPAPDAGLGSADERDPAVS
ncbi:MAG: GAF domain-containing protein [Gaiellales bacterium]